MRRRVGTFSPFIRSGSNRYFDSARAWRIDDSMLATSAGHDGRACMAAISAGEIITMSRMNVVVASSRSPSRSIVSIASATAE